MTMFYGLPTAFWVACALITVVVAAMNIFFWALPPKKTDTAARRADETDGEDEAPLRPAFQHH